MKRLLPFLLLGAPLLSTPAAAQTPGEQPALGTNRITQALIESGTLNSRQIRRKGLELFSTPFNKLDGMGDGPMNPLDPTSPGHRPTLGGNGTLLRINGLDSQTCLECHFVNRNGSLPATLAVGGSGGIAATAFPGPTDLDIDDESGNGFAFFNGRMINPPFVFGAGGVELAGKEMTMELQALKLVAEQNPGTDVALIAKGVDFGTISYDADLGIFNTTNVVGIEPDLVVRPFGRKGDNSSIRKFDTGALQFHHGMQPVEVVGAGVDADDDGVVDEILPGELSAMHIFGVNLDRPLQRGGRSPGVQAGEQIFYAAGCATCHVPTLETNTTRLPIAFPEVETDPLANVFHEVRLDKASRFKKNRQGGVSVRLFSDLKRHDMGPGLAENTGDALDAHFITPRLWGIADSAPYLHDGRALTLTEAIEAHGGEGQVAADAFALLSDQQKIDLLDALRTLRTPGNPSRDLRRP
jgi:hypothetical protein